MSLAVDERVLKIIHHRIAQVNKSGVTVTVDNMLPTVSIDAEGVDGFFMQESEAQEFLDEANRIYEDAQDISFEDACKAVASPYVDLME